MQIQYGNPLAINWLWLAVFCFVVAVVGSLWQSKRLRRFATENLVPQLVAKQSLAGQIARLGLIAVSMLFLTLSLLDIRWGKVWREIPQKGIEVMFVIDVSRSMLAEDVTPNRLSRAKQQINDMLDSMAGDRVGLTVFAGDVRQVVPMTNHFDDFRQTLSDIDTNSVNRGGSRLGDAIRIASNGFLTKTNDHKAMVIFTDGEDQESEPIKYAQQAFGDQGIRIFTVGLGDWQQGARIPVESRNQQDYLQHAGQQVWSKLDGQILKSVATESDGAFIPAGTKQVDMAGVYHRYIASVEQQQFESAKINQYEARFQWFLAIALACFFTEAVWASQRTRTIR